MMVALAISQALSAEALRAASRRESRSKVRLRMLAIASLIEGGEREATARQFGMSRNVLRIWVTRYNRSGIAGLVDQHGGGPQPFLTVDQQAKLKELVLAGADLERDKIVAYRILDIRALAEREFGVHYSHAGMHRLLHAIGCSWLMPRPQHPQSNAEAQAAFKKNSPRFWTPCAPRTLAGP
jgi:transposase